MNEFDLIARLTADLESHPSTVVGVGDDCAVLDLALGDRLLLFKTDAVVEGIHFTEGAPPEKVGHKALARPLSDIAAMAGTPTHALVTLGLSREFDLGYIEGIYRGLRATASHHGVSIAGGETTTNPERIFLAVSVLGTVEKERCALRSGARAGDGIFVTGELGGSRAGHHLEFEPRIEEARWLAGHFPLHSMMDISDGLAGDLKHILKSSRVGAELSSEAIPVSRAARLAARSGGGAKPALLAALTDGEDFELLFTVASRHAVPLLDAWKKRFPKLRLSCIGKVSAEPGLRIKDKRGVSPLTADGYVHFQKS